MSWSGPIYLPGGKGLIVNGKFHKAAQNCCCGCEDCFDCPTISESWTWTELTSTPYVSSTIRLCKARGGFKFSTGAIDDLFVLVEASASVTASFAGDRWTITLPQKHILFKESAGSFGGVYKLTITDGVHTYNREDGTGGTGTQIADLAGYGFTVRDWDPMDGKYPVTLEDLETWGNECYVDVKFVGMGDTGGASVTGVTCDV